MSAPDEYAQAREAISVLAGLPREAVKEAVEAAEAVSNQLGRFWLRAAALLVPVLAAGATWLVLTWWVPVTLNLQGFDVDLQAGGGRQACVRDETSPPERPRYRCARAAEVAR